MMNIRDRAFVADLLGAPFDIIFTFPVLYQGWECDEWGWVVETNEEVPRRVLIGTNHGKPYITTQDELRRNIEQYFDAITKTVEALDLVYELEAEP